MNTLFEDFNQAQIQPAILLIDASGSVKSNYIGTTTIVDKMQDIVSKLSANNFRMIFWNSDANPDKNNFINGVMKLSHVIDKQVIRQPFFLACSRINQFCLTFPHLGFDAIPVEWINNTEPTHIYFITDGQMGYEKCDQKIMATLKSKLKESIESLFKKYNNIHLHIITVENKSMDFNNIEIFKIAAGSDVFNVIQDNNLTKFITEFVSFTPNNDSGYYHINTIIPPVGYIPFNNKCFSESKTNLFVKYLHELIKNTADENDLLKIVQYLSTTVKYLIKDKPKDFVQNIINMFCAMFEHTLLDITIVKFVLSDTVKLETEGKAIVFSEYRSKLKNLYKEAQNMLLQNTKNAIGLTNKFISMPVANVIVYGHHKYVNENIKLGQLYPQSSVKINHLTIPVLPFDSSSSLINEQCIRQYIRQCVATQYGVNGLDDIVIYIVMGIMAQVVISDVDDIFKKQYRQIATIMLKKRRANSESTELDRLEQGELPIPNDGRMDNFYKYMNKVKSILDMKCEPMTMWYILCLALNNQQMVTKQLIHCSDSIMKDYGKVDDLLTKITVTKIKVFEMPDQNIYDYNCVITLESTASTGGFLIKSHKTITGSNCSPIYILSVSGQKSMLEQPECFCPICYTNLTSDNFEKIGPKIDTEKIIFNSDVINPYVIVAKAKSIAKTGTLITMAGTVGSGKSTYAKLIQDKIEQSGGFCLNVGTDKYCKEGMSVKDAIKKIQGEFQKLKSVSNDKIVVIIDTCGEQESNNKYFGTDFTKWKKINVMPNYDCTQLQNYLAWSLRNLLLRSEPNTNCNYWLNPRTASVSTCVDVHNRKSSALFNDKIKVVGTDVDQILIEIGQNADMYQKFLDHKMIIDDEVDKVVKQI